MRINVLDYLEHSAKVFPEKTAFSDPNHGISYSDLVNQAKSLGSKLSNDLSGRMRQPVAVFIDRNIESLISFMGIIYSGNFYVPIDNQLPSRRIEHILKTLHPSAVIYLKNQQQTVDSLGFSGLRIPLEDALALPIDESKLREIRTRSIDTDPLYAIFTSGSTGTPKGALISHRSVIDLIEGFTDIFGFSEKSIFGNQAPFDFDVSVKDIYSTLKNGATMHIIPRVKFSFPIQLIDYLNQFQINTVIWATSALRIVANLKALEKTKPLYLQNIMFSGEVMPNKVLNYWRTHIPEATYVNLYGPTEITCNCSYFVVNRSFADTDTLPIGIPFPNTDILVLNHEDRLVEPGEVGEICVRGTSLALGYYNNPTETAKAFCQNPLNSAYPELIYRTGDLGKYNEFGELIFVSRKDFQIKHMGHRIELGEIEVAANALDFLDVTCCLYDERNEKIVLFYQAAAKQDQEIILGLQQTLPKYMVPNQLIHLEKIPMNKNSKIDRVFLKERFLAN